MALVGNTPGQTRRHEMSFTNEAFKKVTGVSRDADETELVKKLGDAVRATVKSQIATALIVRMLVVEHSWKVNEAAPRVGLSASQAGTMGKRGRVLFECGPGQINLVWSALQAIPSSTIDSLVETLQGMTSDDDRTAYVIRLGVRSTFADRLGTNSTEERLDAMTDAALSDGHRTPVAAKDAAAGLAERLSIPLPKKERKGAAGAAAGGTGADVPTFDAALRMVLSAIAQAQDGADADHPVEITPEQAALVDETLAALVAFADIAKVRVSA